jgi:hypothetical protein
MSLAEEKAKVAFQQTDPDVQFVESILRKVEALGESGTIVIEDPERLKALFTTYNVDPGYDVPKLFADKAKDGIFLQLYGGVKQTMIAHLMRLPDAIWKRKKPATIGGKKTARKMPKGVVVQRICAVVVRPIGSKKALGTRRRR